MELYLFVSIILTDTKIMPTPMIGLKRLLAIEFTVHI